MKLVPRPGPCSAIHHPGSVPLVVLIPRHEEEYTEDVCHTGSTLSPLAVVLYDRFVSRMLSVEISTYADDDGTVETPYAWVMPNPDSCEGRTNGAARSPAVGPRRAPSRRCHHGHRGSTTIGLEESARR